MQIPWNTLPPGSRTDYTLEIEPGKTIPVTVLKGAAPGKAVAVSAGDHGCEYVGIQTARRLPALIRPEKIHGTLVLLPLLNAGGLFRGVRQVMPEDGKDLNRVFPGDPAGSFSQKLAAVIEREIYPAIDFLLDLHGGDMNEELTPVIFYPAAAEPAVTRAALEAAKRLSPALLVASQAKTGPYSYAARKGIPAILLERGGLGRWTEQEVSQDIEDILRLMAHLGMTGGADNPLPHRMIDDAVYEAAPEDGFWYPFTAAGSRVKAGQALGELQRLDGTPIKTFTARWDGVILYHTVSLGAAKGDPLIAYGKWE